MLDRSGMPFVSSAQNATFYLAAAYYELMALEFGDGQILSEEKIAEIGQEFTKALQIHHEGLCYLADAAAS